MLKTPSSLSPTTTLNIQDYLSSPSTFRCGSKKSAKQLIPSSFAITLSANMETNQVDLIITLRFSDTRTVRTVKLANGLAAVQTVISSLLPGVGGTSTSVHLLLNRLNTLLATSQKR